MLRYIKTVIAKQMARNMPGFINVLAKEKIQKIRKLPGADISTDITLSNGTSINVQGAFSQLVIRDKVYFNAFCNVLMFKDARLIIGESVFFNNYCSINCLGHIEIGSKTIFGEGVKIYDHNHNYHYAPNGDLVVEKDLYQIGSVKIGKNCWIGSNVTILKNVEIGDNVIVGANCLLYKSVPANSVVKHVENLIIDQKGNPA